MRRVFVLRPEPGATATLRRARERGLDAHALTLFEIEPVAWEPPNPAAFDALLLTSSNAVRQGGSGLQVLRGLPAHAVGESTAQAAREAGFEVASMGDAGVDELLKEIDADTRLLHLCGEDRTAPDESRQAITPVVVYRARALEGIDLRPATDNVVLVHSRRAGERLAELVDAQAIDRSSIAVAAISPAAAEAAGIGWADVEAADSPADDALLALAERLCNNSPGG